MGSTPLRAPAAEESLRGRPLDAGAIAEAASHAARARARRPTATRRPTTSATWPGADEARAHHARGELTPLRAGLDSIDAVGEALAGRAYLADRALATAVFLAHELEQPLLLEGEAGVGKTEVARALAQATGAELVRLQCHEGIDVHHALYDWDHPRQLLALRAAELGEGRAGDVNLWSEEFLIRRPLLHALEATGDVVLLIDEIDRADDAFEAFLLELLQDFAVTVPELGTLRARAARSSC
jgi:MoxR-like ATPase